MLIQKDTGNVEIRLTQTEALWFSARADIASQVVAANTATGLLVKNQVAALVCKLDGKTYRGRLDYAVAQDLPWLRDKFLITEISDANGDG